MYFFKKSYSADYYNKIKCTWVFETAVSSQGWPLKWWERTYLFSNFLARASTWSRSLSSSLKGSSGLRAGVTLGAFLFSWGGLKKTETSITDKSTRTGNYKTFIAKAELTICSVCVRARIVKSHWIHSEALRLDANYVVVALHLWHLAMPIKLNSIRSKHRKVTTRWHRKRFEICSQWRHVHL